MYIIDILGNYPSGVDREQSYIENCFQRILKFLYLHIRSKKGVCKKSGGHVEPPSTIKVMENYKNFKCHIFSFFVLITLTPQNIYLPAYTQRCSMQKVYKY